MATVLAPSILLGERPDQALDTPPWDTGAPIWDDETAPASPPEAPERTTHSLVEMASRVELAAADEVLIAADDLAEKLRCRAALATLARRAHRRGKSLRLAGGSPELSAMASAEGWLVRGQTVGTIATAALATGPLAAAAPKAAQSQSARVQAVPLPVTPAASDSTNRSLSSRAPAR